MRRAIVNFSCFFLMLIAYGTGNAQQGVITVSNPMAQSREEVITIHWTAIKAAYRDLDTALFKVINVATKQEYPFQLEYRGEQKIQNLLVHLFIPQNGVLKLQLVKGKPKVFAAKTYCRFVPERKDDFAWENDRIAHRAYGKALEKTPNEMAYGIDVWVKRTDRLVINERYKRGNYHEDVGDGLDYYHVGLTLGAGGIAPIISDTIRYAKTFSTWKILDNGPLRSTFQLTYDSWQAGSRMVQMTKTISIDAGSQFSRNEVNFITGDSNPLPVVVGIIKRKEAGTLYLNEQSGVLAYWEPQHGKDGTTGVACIVTDSVHNMKVDETHLLTTSVAYQQRPFVYYHGAAWDKAEKIATADGWFVHTKKFREQLRQALIISIK